MADPDPDPTTTGGVARVAPFHRYYLCIDGTNAVDSVAYAKHLEDKFGWRNLAGEFLERPAGATPGGPDDRLVDPAHPFLPIPLFPAAGHKKPIAVICPGGRNGQGLDPFWQNYAGETTDEQAANGKHDWVFDDGILQQTTFGRHTAATKSSLFMADLILVPAIEQLGFGGKAQAALKEGEVPGSPNPAGPDVFAELLFVSSHGWLGGFMRGDNLLDSKSARPAEAQRHFYPFPFYFLVGRAAAEGRGFMGPKWIILAQCSTVNNATWVLWAKLMAAGLPKVRGVLAYEEVSPAAQGSVGIANAFFQNLANKQPFLDAWRNANAGQKWAAIVHKDALKDRMQDWDGLTDLTTADVSDTAASYLAFGASVRTPQEVFDKPPPFTLTLDRVGKDDKLFPITVDKFDSLRCQFREKGLVRLTVTAPTGDAIASVVVRWVHMRPTHSVQPAVTAMFSEVALPPGAATDLAIQVRGREATLTPTAPGPTVTSLAVEFRMRGPKALEAAGMEQDHSFVWPLAKLTTASGKVLSFPFSTVGLLF